MGKKNPPSMSLVDTYKQRSLVLLLSISLHVVWPNTYDPYRFIATVTSRIETIIVKMASGFDTENIFLVHT